MSEEGCMFKNCQKIRLPGSGYCPHHDILAANEQEDVNKKMERARRFKEYKREKNESLKDSPLRAFNPKFEDAQ